MLLWLIHNSVCLRTVFPQLDAFPFETATFCSFTYTHEAPCSSDICNSEKENNRLAEIFLSIILCLSLFLSAAEIVGDVDFGGRAGGRLGK